MCHSKLEAGPFEDAADAIQDMGYYSRKQVTDTLKKYYGFHSTDVAITKTVDHINIVGSEGVQFAPVTRLATCYPSIERRILKLVQTGILQPVSNSVAIQQAAKDSFYSFEDTVRLV